MTRNETILLLIGGALALAALAGGGTLIVNAWEESANGRKWAPALAAAEQKYGLPSGLLSRQAYQESHFIGSVIDGTQPSPAGALGILQLEPAYFASVRVPVPFTDADTAAQIDEAAAEDARLYRALGSWALTLAAYNWGEGNLQNWLANGGTVPQETQSYVSDITAAVPAAADYQVA
jgi:soluble lytic murein transglycosylase-like protein